MVIPGIAAGVYLSMASRSAAQAKLNTVVDVIGGGLDSEVCSIYLLREGMLELFATKGLAQEAVHVTRMSIGEGLVGTIADNIDMLNLAEATAHPDFSYRPETGEDKFHSFAGVPIVRRERAVGVLCVQHVDPRRYEEVEIEAGVPVLSKIPIVNRFFTNRIDAETELTVVMLMRPEIVIQSENEDILFPGLMDQLNNIGG